MTGRRRGRAWKPDRTGKRCTRCARTWDGHAGTSCYPVPDPAIDAFDPPRPELLEFDDAADASRRSSHSRPGDPVDERDASRVDAVLQVGRRVPRHHGARVDGVTDPAPYDGQPFAPIGALSAAEHAWGRGLVQRGWPELGWAIKGRDGAGYLVATAVLPCGTSEPGMERHCYQTLTPDGLVYRTVTRPDCAATSAVERSCRPRRRRV